MVDAPAPPRKAAIEVFAYLDYRQYLRAYYEAEKARRSSFSYRAFAKKAGLRSPNFLKLVIDGERNLGADSIPKVIAALGLSGKAADFFVDLVAFSQAPTLAEKNRAFERIASSRRFRQARRIEGELFDYLSHWYLPAIRELTARQDFIAEPKWVASQVHPRISPAEAERSLALLLSSGLVLRDPKTGRVSRGEPTLTTEHEVSSLAVKNFHRQMLERAADSIDTVSPQRRDLAALTVCVSEQTAARIKERIHQFREEIAQLCDADERAETVYQLNVQLFPLSVSPGEQEDH